MNTNLEDLQQFTALDPATDREPSGAEWTRSRAALERTMAAPGKRLLTGRRLTIGLAAAAAAVAALVAVPIMLPSAAGEAVASWTPTPGSLTGADVMPQAEACAAGGVGGLDAATLKSSDVVLAEQRGAATLVLVQQGASVVECMMVGTDDTFASMWVADGPLPRPGAEQVTIETQSSVGDGDSQYSQVIGLATDAVTGVDLVLADGEVIRTSTSGGWWSAWWPGPAGGEVDTFTVVVRTADGSRTYRPSQL